MIQFHHVTKRYGAATILDAISLTLNDGEHVGLIGPNGAGKTTLLRLLVGELVPDAGHVSRTPADLAIGHLPQTLAALQQMTVGEALHDGPWGQAAQQVQSAADALADPDDLAQALAAYDAALAAFEALGGYEREHRADAIRDGLGLASIPDATPVAHLSGGQQTRLGLARLLLSEPDMLVLDEPTNHLDIAALEWLEGFVRTYPRTVLVVSHDRAFLDATVTRILHLDAETRQLTSYTGTYTDFVYARAHERELHEEAYRKQQDYIARTEQDIARLKGQALSVELSTTPSQPVVRRIAKKVAKKAKSRERKLERYLASDERVDKPRQTWGLKLDFGEPPEGSRAVLTLDAVSFAHPGQSPLFSRLDLTVAYGERIALVGPNGAGKTTLLRLMAGEYTPTAGQVRLGASVRPGMLTQDQAQLDPRLSILDTARAQRTMSETEARSFLHFFLFAGDRVFQPVGTCSPGERSRLQLALLVLRGCNLLLLDEPLNHLDIDGREHFTDALDAFEGTVIAVSHDRAFVADWAERVVTIGGA